MDKNRSLSAQAQSLKNNIQQRERRRNDSAANRFAGPGSVPDVYEDQPRSRQPVGGESSAAVSALAAITAAAALQKADVFRCDLCQASFTSEPQYHQHLAGPVHRKAEEKVEAERVRRERLGRYGDVADAAVAAANWQGGHVSQGPNSRAQQTPGTASGNSKAGGQQRPNFNKRGANGAQAMMPKAGLSHTQLVAAAHASEEELSINGWVPPSVTAQTSDADEDWNDDASGSSSDGAEEQDAHTAAVLETDHTGAAAAEHSTGAEGKIVSGLGLLYSSDSGSDDSGSLDSDDGDADEGDDQTGGTKRPRTSYF